jgi:16S rRNA (guanine966-N2)-methyltransferase
VTRIVAGFAGSLALSVPRAGTRPTSDRVREAIFSALEARGVLDGAHVLDLYAGSGALGLEAASRGAASVTLVDSGKNATEICRSNARALLQAAPPGRSPSFDVVTSSVQAFLGRARATYSGFDAGVGGENLAQSYDLVFADPPYDLSDADLARALLALVPLLAKDATVVVERSSRSPEPTLPDELTVARHKTYGDTSVWWLLTD